MKAPIAEPFPAPKAAEGGPVFRVDFLCVSFNYFWSLWTIVIPECLVLQWLLPIKRLPNALPLLFLFLLLLMVIALLAATFTIGFSIRFDGQGLKHQQSLWGSPREVEWNEITRIRRGWVGIPYALISTTRRRNGVWVPLVLSDMSGFARAVEELAPADNPLRLWLRKRDYR